MTPDQWQTSSYSGENGDCVQVKRGRNTKDVHVRDSKDQDGLVMRFSRDEFDRFIAKMKAGAFHV